MSPAGPTFHDIVNAAHRLSGRVRRTPLVEASPRLAGSGRVALKLESLQETGSFKLRGALNAVAARAEREAARGAGRPKLVTASAGNHGQALALACRRLGLDVVVFTSTTAPLTKRDAIARYGADLRAEAADYDETETLAHRFARETGAIFVSPYNDPAVIAGAGTVALEVLDYQPDIDTFVVPVGGGGLLSGVAIAVRALAPSARIIGVEPAHNPAFTSALAAGRTVPIVPQPTVADGLSGNMEPGSITFDIVRALVDEVVTVDETALVAAMRHLLVDEHLVAEGAGAAGVAALLSGKVKASGRSVAVIVSGANVDANVLALALSPEP
jgi:threonine dehydratase